MVTLFKKNWYYILIFIFVFSLYYIFNFPSAYGDPIAMYGFSYAITKGEIPYLDFNIISTPLYAFLMAIGLLFWNNFTMLLIEQALLVTLFFYILERTFGKKSFIIMFFISLFSGYALNATYNFLVLFFLILLIFLEKNYKEKDILIGIVIGLAILSKHTVGCFFAIPTLIYYFKDKKKIGRRVLGAFIPLSIFFLYLLLTKSLWPFIDLCFLGLFDFGSNNNHLFTTLFFVSVALFFISLFITIRNRDDIANLYLLFGIAFVIPIFDPPHFSLYMVCVLLQLVPFIKKYGDYLGILSFIVSFVIFVCVFFFMTKDYNIVLNKGIKHFEFFYNVDSNYTRIINDYNIIDSYANPLVLSYSKIQYDISRDKKLDYFGVLLYGNFGYNGDEKMINKIGNMHDRYILVDRKDYEKNDSYSQFDKNIVNYVIENCNKIGSEGSFDIYYKK